MKSEAITAEQNKMKRVLFKRIEKEQEKCILKNEIRKEKAATDLHIQKMRFMMEERNLAHIYHCSKFQYAKAQRDEADATKLFEKENAKLQEIESLIEREYMERSPDDRKLYLFCAT